MVDASGRYAAFGGDRLTVWDLDTGQLTFAVPLPVIAMAWSDCEPAEDRPADDHTTCRLVTVGQSLDVLDPEPGRRVQLIDQTDAQSVAISADGQTVVTAGWRLTVAVWRMRPIPDDSARVEVTEQEIEELWGESGLGLDFDGLCSSDSQATRAMSPSGRYVVTYANDDDGTTKVCDTNDGRVVATGSLGDNTVPVSAVAVDDEGDVALGGGDGFVERYRRQDRTFATCDAFTDIRSGGQPVEVTSLAYHAGTIVAGVRTADQAAMALVLVWTVDDSGTSTVFPTDYREVPAIRLLGDHATDMVAAERYWAVEQTAAERFATTLYRDLLAGEDFGDAVATAEYRLGENERDR